MNEKHIIVWDLGATKCAAALVWFTPDTCLLRCQKSCSLLLEDVDSLMALINSLEDQLGYKHRDADAVCIGAAGIFDGHNLQLEKGYPFDLPFAKLAKALSWPTWFVVHDYTPILCATFVKNLPCITIHLGESIDRGRRVALGIGTGLGLKDGALMPDGDFFIGSNEMGHIGIPMPLQAPPDILAFHRDLLGNQAYSFENIVSGPGMLRLHNFLNPTHKATTPHEVGELVRHNKALDTLRYFSFYTGLFCATVQLAFMPSGGMWISGGVALKHLEIFEQPEFFMGLNAFPAYALERKKFALNVINDPVAAFMGGAWYAAKRSWPTNANTYTCYLNK